MRFDQELFGKRIRQLRVAMDMSQEELSVKVNAERSHIAKIENGVRLCSVDLLISFSMIFDTSTDYLLFGTSRSLSVKSELMEVVKTLVKVTRKL